MSTTALPAQRASLRRNLTVDSVPSTSPNSPAGSSPSDSPIGSASSTSLSSLGSVEDFQRKPEQKLLDTYGNEFKLPDYTIKDIRDAIPKHCYERSAATGLYYVARDIVSLAGTFYLFNTVCTPEYVPSTVARAVLWGVYTFIQGLFGTGLWVLAHECGHQSFSSSKTLNDTVGWLCHSALLVPYFSWKISHGKHHKATGNMERDMVFLPRTREEHASRMGYVLHEMHELLEETPIYTMTMLIGQQVVGWPYYLFANVTGHNNHSKQPEGKGHGKKNGDFSVNHFLPSSPLYERKDEKLILLSDLGLAITASILFLIGKSYGLQNLLVWYGIPYLWVNHWLGECIISRVIILSNLLTSASQLLSPTSSTPTRHFPTTPARPGTLPAGPPLPLTASLGSSGVSSSTASSRLTCCTTTSAPFLSTTPTKPPKPSSRSWASTTAQMLREALSDSSRRCTRVPDGANGLSRMRALPARTRTCCSSATGTVLVLSRRRFKIQQ
ncbi:delta-12 desaturase [Teratosphaeria destructans]|uniref:Delta-12 desaturase n=1 Tax=Teratosphaeria destructans TaxID=418781 RepID=A0A9W7T160_9PEZI|nr:delta-12 desaturase [Teratosphaeria destructans]